MAVPVSIVLVGDSDISRWPVDLYPKGTTHNLGQNGATLQDVNRIIREATITTIKNGRNIFVVCAGENDLGSGISLEASEREMNSLLETLLRLNSQNCVIFLGPKFEPWLANDKAARKAYLELNKMQQKACSSLTPKAHFVDCLTMFCGDSATVPGARLAGRAMPEEHFFDADGLHLSREGYELWESAVGEVIDDC